MSDSTLATRPLDEALVDLVRSRSHGRGYTDLHPRLDLPRLLKAMTGVDPTAKAVRAILRRVGGETILVEKRRGGVLRLRPIDGSTCPLCGSGIR